MVVMHRGGVVCGVVMCGGVVCGVVMCGGVVWSCVVVWCGCDAQVWCGHVMHRCGVAM